MIQYSVEIFDRNFNLKHHTNVSDIEYSYDYLSPQSNDLIILSCDIEKNDYIRVYNAENEYFGIIKSITNQERDLITVSYDDFLSVFDTDILFDTDLQGGNVSLEQTLANLISDMFISNTDSSMNISGLSVVTQGATSDWGFNLKSDTEGMHRCIINFYKVLIVRSLESYSVRIKPVVDVQNRTIKLYIGKNPNSVMNLEADLPNIIEKNIIIKETDNDTNKLIVYNSENYTTTRTYYLHPNGTYNTTNSNRILPVRQEIRATKPEYEGDTIRKTFATMANAEASNVFGTIQYNNLIEVVVLNNDTLVKPYEIDIGQVVSVLYEGKIYNSILTGFTRSTRTLLSFGTIRIDLTKILKRRYS